MSEELIKRNHLAEDNFLAVYPGVTSAFGGMLFSPFWDDKLESLWLRINNYKRDNFFVVEIKKYYKPIEEFKNYAEHSLDDFLGAFKFLDDIDEDSDDYFQYEDKIEAYKELKEHCYSVLGEKYFE